LRSCLLSAILEQNQNNGEVDYMTATTEKALNDALSLPPIERAELIQRLLQSFNVSEDNHIDTGWTEKVESKIEAYDKGLLTASPAEDVLTRINRR